jgi:hypothetical protein
MEHPGNPNVFAIGCAFPRGLRFVVQSQLQTGQLLDPKLCKDYAAAILEECTKRGRPDLVERTNWASVAAAVQRCISDWNDKRAAGTPQAIQ